MPNIRFLPLLALLPILLVCGPKPRPNGGPPTSLDAATPTTWTDTARLLVEELRLALPIIDQVVAGTPGIDPVIVAGTHRAVTSALSEAIPGFSRAVDVYEARGASRCRDASAECCEAYRASGALHEALLGIVQMLIRGGWNTAVDIRRGLEGLGVIENDLAATCETDAGWTNYAELLRLRVGAMQSDVLLDGGHLQPFPSLSRASTSSPSPR